MASKASYFTRGLLLPLRPLQWLSEALKGLTDKLSRPPIGLYKWYWYASSAWTKEGYHIRYWKHGEYCVADDENYVRATTAQEAIEKIRERTGIETFYRMPWEKYLNVGDGSGVIRAEESRTN